MKVLARIRVVVAVAVLAVGHVNAKNGFEWYGDIFQIALPLATFSYAATSGDYAGAKQQALGSAATLAFTGAVKYSLNGIAKKHPERVKFAQRPNNGNYQGMPSGHTSFAFSAVGYAQKRYGWQASVPLGVLATAVGVSRIHAERHTTAQVIAGAITGFAISYFLASPKDSSRDSASIVIAPIKGGAYASVNFEF